MKKLIRGMVAISVFAWALAPAPGQATLIHLNAVIDGAQANAGAGTTDPGTGTAKMTFDTMTNLFNWNITYGGLATAVIAAHFHGPALPNQNAVVQVPIGLANPAIASATLTAGQALDLLADLWYINIHTQQFPAGAIRGQVKVPEPATLAIFGLGLAFLGAMRRRKRAA